MIRQGEIYARRGELGFLPAEALVRAWQAAGAVNGLSQGLYVADMRGRATPGFGRLWWAAFGTRPPMADAIVEAGGEATAYLVRSWPS